MCRLPLRFAVAQLANGFCNRHGFSVPALVLYPCLLLPPCPKEVLSLRDNFYLAAVVEQLVRHEIAHIRLPIYVNAA